MTEYLLDTNHASPLITLDHPLRERFRNAIRAGHSFALTTDGDCDAVPRLPHHNWLTSAA